MGERKDLERKRLEGKQKKQWRERGG